MLAKQFQYNAGRLLCEGVDVAEIAKEIGTPVYIYSKNAIRESAQKVKSGLPDENFLFRYALKANSNPEIIALLCGLGFGADVVSGGELQLALDSGVPASQIVFAGVGKQVWELRAALDLNVSELSLESTWEIDRIASLLPDFPNTQSRFLVRTNPGVGGGTHRYMVTGLEENKFGIHANDVISRYRDWQHELGDRLDGIQVHIGSGITDIDYFQEAAEMAASFVRDIRSRGGRVTVLDFGGGVGVHYESHEEVDWSRYKQIVTSLQQELGVTIVLEPGKAVVAESGIALTEIIQRKVGTERNFLIVDLGMNDLMRPALYDAHHGILPLWQGSEPSSMITADVVGPVCESGDFIAKDRKLPSLQSGDLLAVLTAGAYCYSMSSNYNERPRPAEVMVDGSTFKSIRPRESHGQALRSKYR